MNITDTAAIATSRVDQRKARYSKPRTPQPTRWISIESSGIGEEADDQRGGNFSSRRCSAGEMGEA
jgi:hypothetical protein